MAHNARPDVDGEVLQLQGIISQRITNGNYSIVEWVGEKRLTLTLGQREGHRATSQSAERPMMFAPLRTAGNRVVQVSQPSQAEGHPRMMRAVLLKTRIRVARMNKNLYTRFTQHECTSRLR